MKGKKSLLRLLKISVVQAISLPILILSRKTKGINGKIKIPKNFQKVSSYLMFTADYYV